MNNQTVKIDFCDIDNINNKYILCVGMSVLDIIHLCKEFPEEDSDRRSSHGRWQRGGNASNICTVLRQFDVKCEFLGTFSSNKMFKFVIDDMIERNISIENCVYHDNCQAPLSSVILSEATGTRTIIHSNPNLPILTFKNFVKINLQKYKWIHFEARNREETIKMMEHVKNWNLYKAETGPIKISLDLEQICKENLVLVKYADIVFLGKDLANHFEFKDKKTAVFKFRKITRPGYTIICPWGSDGVAALDDHDQFYAERAYPPEKIIDTLGAGDTFAASIIYALSNQKSLPISLKFACKISGAKIGFFGYDKIGQIFNTFDWDT